MILTLIALIVPSTGAQFPHTSARTYAGGAVASAGGVTAVAQLPFGGGAFGFDYGMEPAYNPYYRPPPPPQHGWGGGQTHQHQPWASGGSFTLSPINPFLVGQPRPNPFLAGKLPITTPKPTPPNPYLVGHPMPPYHHPPNNRPQQPHMPPAPAHPGQQQPQQHQQNNPQQQQNHNNRPNNINNNNNSNNHPGNNQQNSNQKPHQNQQNTHNTPSTNNNKNPNTNVRPVQPQPISPRPPSPPSSTTQPAAATTSSTTPATTATSPQPVEPTTVRPTLPPGLIASIFDLTPDSVSSIGSSTPATSDIGLSTLPISPNIFQPKPPTIKPRRDFVYPDSKSYVHRPDTTDTLAFGIDPR